MKGLHVYSCVTFFVVKQTDDEYENYLKNCFVAIVLLLCEEQLKES